VASNAEDVLDRCVEAVRRGGDPEAVLREHGDVADEVRPLIALAAELRGLPAPQPSAHGLERALAHVALEGAARPRRRPFFRRVSVIAAAAVLLVLAGWGILGMAAGTVPGDFLYPVKRLAERVSYSLTLRADRRAELRLARSDERLKEAVLKHRRGQGIDRELLRAMLDETVQALEAASALSPASREVVLHRVACSCQFQCQLLAALREGSSPQELEALKPFMAACDARCTCMQEAVAGAAPDAAAIAQLAARLRELAPPER